MAEVSHAAIGYQKIVDEFYNRVGIIMPPHAERKQSEDIEIVLIGLKGFNNVPLKDLVEKTTIHVEAALYDSTHRQLFGNKWIGPSVPLKIPVERPASINIDYRQNVYFYTSQVEPSVIVLLELVASLPSVSAPFAPAAAAPSTAPPDRIGSRLLGWCLLRPFRMGLELPDSGEGRAIPVEQYELSFGSPRALLFLDEPFEPQLRLQAGFQLQVSLSRHSPLSSCIHYMRENTLVGSNQVVTGILSPEKGRDPFSRPKVHPTTTHYADQLQVFLYPSLEAFEREFLENLTADRTNREGNVPEGGPIRITERRLLMGVVNGWTYVDNPEVAHLHPTRTGEQDTGDAVSIGGSMKKSKSSAKTLIPSADQPAHPADKTLTVPKMFLTSKHRVELTDLFDDSPFSQVVLILEYLISEPVAARPGSGRPPSAAMASTRKITLRFCICNPLIDRAIHMKPSSTGLGKEVRVRLLGGALMNPESQLMFRSPGEGEDPKKLLVEVAFRFYSQDELTHGAVQPPLGLTAEQLALAKQKETEELIRKGQFLDPSGAHGTMQFGRTDSLMRQAQQPQPPQFTPAVSATLQPGLPSGLPQQPPPSQVWQQQQQQQLAAQLAGGPHALMAQMMASRAVTAPPMELATWLGLGGPMQLPPSAHPTTQVVVRPPAQVSRSTFARLYSAGFPYILDRRGNHAELVDTTVPFSFDLSREDQDPLKSNEFVIQFLAFSKFNESQTGAPAPKESIAVDPPSSLYFTFQFYRFPQCTTERLMLRAQDVSDPEEERLGFSAPFILQRPVSADEAQKSMRMQIEPGLTLRFTLDPLYMKPGERLQFLQYMNEQPLHIDVWDGDSLMLLGSCAVDLMRLCRQGHEAVQTTYELDVLKTEYIDDLSRAPDQTMPFTQSVGIEMGLRGRLHVRLGNIGLPTDSRMQALELNQDRKRYVIRKEDSQNATFGGGLLASTSPDGKTATSMRLDRTVSKAVPAMARNRELVEVLATRRQTRAESLGMTVEGLGLDGQPLSLSGDQSMRSLGSQGGENTRTSADMTLPIPDQNPERKRKLLRMAAVRQSEHYAPGDPNFQSYLSMKMVREERARDLQTVAVYRSQQKRDGILNLLAGSITTEHIIFPSLGSSEFFEFAFTNTTSQPQTVLIHHNDADLHVITDSVEWRYFKSIYGVTTPFEENLFSSAAPSGSAANPANPQVNGAGAALTLSFFARPRETIYVPFKFLSMQADHSVFPMGPPKSNAQGGSWSLKALQQEQTTVKIGTTGTPLVSTPGQREIRVQFMSVQENKQLAVLKLSVQPQPHSVDQTFRFYQPEQSFLKRAIRLPPMAALPGVPIGTAAGAAGMQLVQVLARCSDPNTLVETHPVQLGEPHDIFIKAACGPSPQIKRFYVAIYRDLYLARPVHIWQFYVHCLQPMDVSCTEGQTSRFSLLLRGTQAARLVAAYSSHAQELQPSPGPSEPFILAPNAAHELQVLLKARKAGNRFMQLNIVDNELKQLVRSWLINVACRPPVINRAFELHLPLGGGKEYNKRVSFTNQYSTKKRFHVQSSRPDLLQFKDEWFDVGPSASEEISLKFQPVSSTTAADVVVYINDENDQTEQAFCIRAIFA